MMGRAVQDKDMEDKVISGLVNSWNARVGQDDVREFIESFAGNLGVEDEFWARIHAEEMHE